MKVEETGCDRLIIQMPILVRSIVLTFFHLDRFYLQFQTLNN